MSTKANNSQVSTKAKNSQVDVDETSAGGQVGVSEPPCKCGCKWLTTGRLILLIALAVILIDQIVKFYIKLHFYLYEEVEVLPWFRIVFVQNPGMAFGWTIGSKLLLTLFRMVFIAVLIWAVFKLRNARLKRGFTICVGLILAGAIGNLIDCLFYGLIFNNPIPPQVATLFPEGGGYAPMFHGMVVDMLHFPLFHFYWPDWMPLCGDQYFEFFSPVFNIADAAISVGILVLIFFYSKELNVAVKQIEHKVKPTD